MPGGSPGTLYVVSTPIGNLEDITLRALRVLRESQLIAAEDTRRTARLLQHYSISTPTTSFHEHNERQKLPGLVARLKAGQSVALVSDAGTPTISDPGARLIGAARDAGIKVESVPGPSAVTAILAAAGIESDGFTFVGFAPNRSSDRKRWLSGLATEARPIVFFEAPHRIRACLTDALDVLGNRPIIIGRELTKLHEELIVGQLAEVQERIGEPRGEYTILLPARDAGTDAAHPQPTAEQIRTEYGQLTNSGASRRAALQLLAKRHHLSARLVFALLEKAKA